MSSTSDSLCFLHLRHVLSICTLKALSDSFVESRSLHLSLLARLCVVPCLWHGSAHRTLRHRRVFRQRACWVGCLGLYKTCSSHLFAKCSPGRYVCGRVYMSGGRPAEGKGGGGGGCFGGMGEKKGKFYKAQPESSLMLRALDHDEWLFLLADYSIYMKWLITLCFCLDGEHQFPTSTAPILPGSFEAPPRQSHPIPSVYPTRANSHAEFNI